ncbi:MAG TPA: TetR/AcrR family transcriptional regulator [Solirubrobacter sp.]
MSDRAATRYARPKASERVLEIASELFYEEGIQSVGVDRIAAESDTSKATLYAHYGNKDGLIAAYIERYTSQAQERIAATLERAGADPRARIVALFDDLADWHCEADFRGCAFINAGGELADPAHPAIAIGRAHRAWVRDVFGGLAAASGAPDAHAAGTQLLMLYDAATITANLDGTTDAAALGRDVAERLLDSWASQAG